jgi:tetratricopeptide (TPR) repeat protein
MRTPTMLLLILAFVSCSSKGNPDQLFLEGANCIEQGEYDKGIDLYQRALALAPESAKGYNLLGMAYRFKYNQTAEQGWRDKEIASFQKLLELDPDFAVALVNLGATYYYSGRKQMAVPYFKHALEVYPEHPEAEQIKQMITEGESLIIDE